MSRTRVAVLAVVLIAAVAGGIEGGPYLWLLLRYYHHSYVTAPRESAAVADWRQAFGDPDALLASYTRKDDNATAKRLVALGIPLGIELEGFEQSSSEIYTTAFGKYVDAEQPAGSGNRPDPPAGDVRSYLDGHRADLDAVVALLTTAEEPVWKCDMSGIVPESSGNVVGIRLLNNILAADALDKASQGRSSDADRTMRAVWQLARSSRGQPLMIGELMAIALATTDAATIRRLEVDPAFWQPRLAEYDYPASLQRAAEAETLYRTRAKADASMTSRAFRADYLDDMRANLVRMRAVSLTDPIDPGPDMKHLPMAAPAKTIALIAGPGLERMWLTALGVMLEFELTDRVLDARQLKTKTGLWPDAMPDVPSAVFPAAKWVYAVNRDGMVSISLDRDVPSSRPRRLRFEVRR